MYTKKPHLKAFEDYKQWLEIATPTRYKNVASTTRIKCQTSSAIKPN